MSLFTLAVLLLVSQPSPVRYTVHQDKLLATAADGQVTTVSLPCAGLAVVAAADRLYVACGEQGVAIFTLATPTAPTLAAQKDLGGRVTGLHVALGQVWAEITSVAARVVAETGEAAATAAAAASTSAAVAGSVADAGRPAPAPARVGEVIESRTDGVVTNLGTGAGVARGQKIELFLEEEVSLASAEEAAIREQVVAVGVVNVVSEGHSQVGLGLNEAVPVGAKARVSTKEPTSSRFLPPRAAGVWSATFSLRPFFALGAAGVGTVSDARVSYRMDAPVHLQAILEPLGVGLVDVGNIFATAGNVVLSYDTRVFEVGLGAGWSAVNNELDAGVADSRAAAEGVGAITGKFDNVNYGTSIAQVARLGAEDGIHLQARNTFIYYHKELHYGGTVGRLQVPVGGSSWVLAQGGGGASGFAYGELGLRLLLMGNGLADSLFATASLGGAGLFADIPAPKSKCESYNADHYWGRGDKCFKSVSYGGPMVGVAVEWRP
ncbi:MAG: hypothetical protein HY903_19010 [Deltaproteobacteria bacterium]|nr:hypothetical protein [Deltaproteobacteria bacterium]